MSFALDACAVIEYFRGEAGGEVVRDLLLDPTNRFLMHNVNLCEVYYDFVRRDGISSARGMVVDLVRLGVELKRTMDRQLVQQVGELKASIRRISLADCFAIATANRFDATVLTSDHREFDPVVAAGHCRVQFIR